MDVHVSKTDHVTIVKLSGDLDSVSAPEAQARIVPLAQPDCRLILDMSEVGYMSSAGLRMMLVMSRSVAGQGGRVVLVGLSEDLEDTMAVTGFLDFFHFFSQRHLPVQIRIGSRVHFSQAQAYPPPLRVDLDDA